MSQKTDTDLGNLEIYTTTKPGFFLANRRVSTLPAALSLAASWIWVQALFVSTGQAWLNGWVGLLWFAVPNTLALILFAPFLKRLVQRVPDGYTVSSYYRDRFSKRVQGAVLLQYGVHALGGFTVNLLVGGLLISLITGINPALLITAIGLIAFTYTSIAGMKASIVTDWMMYAFILIAAFMIVPLAINVVGGLGALDYTGVNNIASPLSAGGLNVALTFGIPVTLILLSGPMTEQMYWSRGWAVAQRGNPFKVAMLAALFFAIIPITLGFLGFTAATLGVQVDDFTQSGLVALQTIIADDPTWTLALIPYAGIAICGVMSSADSALNSIGNVVGHDLTGRTSNDRISVRNSRLGMVGATIVSIGVANIPEMNMLWIWFFYGAVRVATWAPTMFALAARHDRVNEQGMFWGIIAGFLTGVPLLTTGFITNNHILDSAGVIGALIASSAVLLIFSRRGHSTAA